MQLQRAPVRPRVLSPLSGEALLLEDEICQLALSGKCEAVALIGPPGSGKTTVLAHLLSTLPPAANVVFLDEPTVRIVLEAIDAEKTSQSGSRLPVVFTSAGAVPQLEGFVRFQLAPWGVDEIIEYLMAVHRPRCASVMERLPADDRRLFDGLAEVWAIVLDQLAEDGSIRGARPALYRYLERQLPDTDLVERARSACLNILTARDPDSTAAIENLGKPGFTRGLLRLLRHAPVQLVLATERVAADLHSDADCDFLALRLPRELVQSVATSVAGDPAALEHLQQLLAGPDWSHAMAASILHLSKTGWVPQAGLTALAGAYLPALRWPSAALTDAKLAWIDLSNADLRRAILCAADLGRANLSGALLQAARLSQVNATAADLAHADLSWVQAARAKFDDANLQGANLDDAHLEDTSFVGADLTRASLRGADLSRAILVDADIKGADFAAASLKYAHLDGLSLREAYFAGASFDRASLIQCDLEGMDLPEADFKGAILRDALLTGSSMPGANFMGANLCNAKLAEVNWEGAILCGADLRGATFHMGSSRSGLVGSIIPCEGSKTGFYTDDFNDQEFKPPEEIRKANLCGADLRGAQIDDVDFYLVDLRGARFDTKQAHHLRGCGAILDCRR